MRGESRESTEFLCLCGFYLKYGKAVRPYVWRNNCACPRDPLREPDPSRARVAAALAGPGWRLAQSSLAQAGGAGRAAPAGALPLSHTSRAQRVPGATQPTLGLTFSTYLVPCFHGLVLTILAQVGCTTPTATPPFVLAADMETCSMLNVVWPYIGSGQWTAKVKPRLVAC